VIEDGAAFLPVVDVVLVLSDDVAVV